MSTYNAVSAGRGKPMFSFLIANLIRAVASYEAPDAFTRRHPNVDRSSAKREEVLAWLEDNSPASARQIAETFKIPTTTAHFYLNTLIIDGCVMRIQGKNHYLFKTILD